MNIPLEGIITSNPIIKEGIEFVLSRVSQGDFEGKKVLITGGAGFLGSWLCDVLVKFRAHVVCLDNLSTGRIENIKHLFSYKNFSFIKVDVNNWEISEGFNIIIHGASIPSPDDYMSRPIETMLSNSLGLMKLLEIAGKSKSTLLFMSTSEVYGDAEVIPTPETYWGKVNPLGFRSCYDESKRFGEALCMAYFRQYGVDVRIARIFNTYGPRMNPEAKYARVIPRFIIQSLKGKPITVHGNGQQTRSFCYVTDIIIALLKMLIEKRIKGQVINIGNPHEIKIVELAKLIKKLTGSSSAIVFRPPRPDDPRRRCPDISKARELLNWEPKISLEEGLKLTIEWFKKVI